MKLKLLTVIVVGAAMGLGCQTGKKSSTTPMSSTALDVATAPAVQYTPPPAAQPVVYDTTKDAAQPVIGDSVADASDTVAPERAPAPTKHVATPQRKVSSGKATVASAKGTKYTVKKGESLWSIAKSHYGDGNKWKAIASANPKLDPNKVVAGQTITLP